jgi:hypothetical protein
MKTYNRKLIVLLTFTLLLAASNLFASNLGILYEQVYDGSNTVIPAATISGATSVANNSTLALTATPSVCSGCIPSYYWEADGGTFQGSPNSSTVTWVPPKTNSTQVFNIQCIVGDGKGREASAWKSVTVGNTVTACTSTVSAPTFYNPGLYTETTSLSLGWQNVNNATQYTLQESTTSNFASSTIYNYSAPTSSATLTGKANGIYYYRVKAQNNCGISTWSNIVQLEVRANAPPNAASSPSPANTATGVSRTPYLSWTGGDSDGSADYAVEYGTDPSNMWFIQGYESPNKYNNSMQISWSLNPSTTYYWRVRAKDDKGAITIGPTWSFTTSSQSADLVASAIDVVGTVANGQTVTVNVTVQNQGDFLADGGTIGFYYSSFENGKDAEYKYAWRGVPQLSPGQSAVISTTLTIQGLKAGSSYLVANIVPLVQATESDLSNNTISYPISYTDTTAPNIQYFDYRYPNGNTFKTNAKSTFVYTVLDDISVAGVDLYYSTNNGSTWTSIATNFPVTNGGFGNGYDWVIPAATPLNNQFKVRIVAKDGSGNSSEKILGPFTIIDGSTPAISFTSPLGGEVWALGSTKTISWTASSPNGIKKVQLTYWYAANQATSIAQLSTNPGSYAWTLPTVSTFASNDAKIAIEVTDNNNNTVRLTSNSFTVADASAPPPAPWGSQTQITTVPVIGTLYTSQGDSGPATTVDKFGNVHLVYMYSEDNMSNYLSSSNPQYVYPGRILTYKLYYMKKTGSSWSSPTVLKTIVNNQDLTQSQGARYVRGLTVVADSNGNPHVAWQESLDDNIATIYHMYFNGSSWATPVNISNSANVGAFAWANMPNPPIAIGSGMVRMAAISDSVYVGGLGGYSLRLYKYNRTANLWSQMADIPYTWSGFSDADVCTYGGMLYAADTSGNFIMYNPTSNTWTQKANLLQSGSGVRLAAVGSYIYAVGANQTNTIQAYDPASNTWSYKAAAPTARGYTATVALNNKLLVIGGRDTNNNYKKMEEYDPAANTWKTKVDTQLLSGIMGGAEIVNGRIYLTAKDFATIEMYDPTTNYWIAMDRMPTRYSYGDTAVLSDGKLYVLGSDQNGNAGFIQGTLTGSDGTIPKRPYSPSLTADLNSNVYVYWLDGRYTSGVDGQPWPNLSGTDNLYAKKINATTGIYSAATSVVPTSKYVVKSAGNSFHAVCQDPSSNALNYVYTLDGSSWTIPVAVPIDSSNPNQYYENFDIATDTTGNVHFVGRVFNAGISSLIYKNLFGDGRFQSESIVNNTSWSPNPFSISVDNQNNPIVLYNRSDNSSVNLTKRLTDGTWTDGIISEPASQYISSFNSATDVITNKLHLVYEAYTSGHTELFYNAADLSGDFQAAVATLTGPNTGDVVTGGNASPLSWTVSDDKGISSVLLKYTIDGGATFTTIADNLTATGSYSWTVPNQATTSMQVYLVATDTASKQTVVKSNIFTVNFIPSYQISISKTGSGSGSVSASSGLNCGATCSANYTANTVVALSPMSVTGSHFSGWSGACSGTGTCNVLADSAKSVTASFVLDPVNGVCGSSNTSIFTVQPTTNLCTAGTATTVSGSGPWSWNCTGANLGTSASCTANIQSYALFFTADVNGSLTGTTSQTVNHGANATTVTAIPVSGYHFTNWMEGATVVATTAALTVNNVTAAHSYTANFAADPVNGACGSSNGGKFAIAPATSLCTAGAVSAVTGSGPWSWSCNGTNGGTNATCTAAVDKTGPALTVSTLANGAITNNATLNISGVVTDSSSVAGVTINNTAVTVISGGFSSAIALQTGVNTITTVATDALGNTTTDTRTITLDQTAPILTVTAPADNSKTAQAAATITGTVNETSTVAVKIGNGTPQNANMSGATYSASVTLAEGLNTVTITATDLAGNKTDSVRTVIFDNSKPSLAISAPSQDITTAQNSITISGTVSDTITTTFVSINFNSQTLTPTVTNGEFSHQLTFPAEGTYPVIVTATDEVGNSISVTRNIIYAITVNGACGSSNGGTFAAIPTANLCTTGSAGNVVGNGHPWIWSCNGTNSSNSDSCAATIASYAVTFTTDSNGTLSGAASQTIDAGAAISQITAIPNSGYSFLNWTGTNGFATTSANPLTLSAITATQAITANFTTSPINGACGSINGGTFTVAPTTNFCTSGTASSLTGSGPWSWSCSGTNGGNTVNCSANIQTYSTTAAVTGGNGTVTCTSPTKFGATSICTITPVTGYQLATFTDNSIDKKSSITSGSYGITSIAANHAITATFSLIPASPVNGVCGTNNNGSFTIAPTTGLCTIGTASAITGSGPWNWTCSGSNGGSTANCAATKAAPEDTTPPTLILSILADGAITANATLNISGTASDSGSGVKNLTINGTGQTLAADGSFSTAITLVDGSNTITIVAADNAGNTRTNTRTITLDTAAPVLTITAPADNSTTTQTQTTITGTINETSTVIATVNNGTPQSAAITGSSFSVTVNLASGVNTIDIVATDLAGNKTTAKRTVTSAPTALTLAITVPNQDISTTQGSFTIGGTVTDTGSSATLTITADGHTYTPSIAADGSFSQTIILAVDKTYAVVATATDLAGNNASVTRNIIKLAPLSSPTIADALKVLLAINGTTPLTAAELIRYDVAPLSDTGTPAGNGTIDDADVILLLRRSIGIGSW